MTRRPRRGGLPGCGLSTVKEFRFEARPYSYVKFRNVSLEPGKRTQVEVVNEEGHDLTSEQATSPTPGDIFATTHWTVVLAAGRRSTPQSDRALEELCRTYWYPLYAYVRRHGHSKEDAEDLTQGFFAALPEAELPGGPQQREGPLPRVPAGGAEAFPGQ